MGQAHPEPCRPHGQSTSPHGPCAQGLRSPRGHQHVGPPHQPHPDAGPVHVLPAICKRRLLARRQPQSSCTTATAGAQRRSGCSAHDRDQDWVSGRGAGPWAGGGREPAQPQGVPAAPPVLIATGHGLDLHSVSRATQPCKADATSKVIRRIRAVGLGEHAGAGRRRDRCSFLAALLLRQGPASGQESAQHSEGSQRQSRGKPRPGVAVSHILLVQSE